MLSSHFSAPPLELGLTVGLDKSLPRDDDPASSQGDPSEADA